MSSQQYDGKKNSSGKGGLGGTRYIFRSRSGFKILRSNLGRGRIILKSPPGGNIGGTQMGEATLDSKGRIVIPDKIRKKVGLRTGSKVRVHAGGKSIIIMGSVEPKEFIGEMEGVIKKGSPVEVFDPLKLKEMWA